LLSAANRDGLATVAGLDADAPETARMRQNGVMRIQTAKLVSLGHGRFVRSDDVVAVEPVAEGRGPGRRCLVWVRNVPDPIVASRSELAIAHDLTTPSEAAVAPEPRPLRRGLLSRLGDRREPRARPQPPA
jgi:hypothetical protein